MSSSRRRVLRGRNPPAKTASSAGGGTSRGVAAVAQGVGQPPPAPPLPTSNRSVTTGTAKTTTVTANTSVAEIPTKPTITSTTVTRSDTILDATDDVTSSSSPRDEIVGELEQSSPQQQPQPQHPYTSIALSPSKKHAVTATNDTLQILRISPSGLTLLQSIPCAPLFIQSSTSTTTTATPSSSSTTTATAASSSSSTTTISHRMIQNPLTGWRGAQANFNSYAMAHGSTARGPTLTNVVINDVAWSHHVSPSIQQQQQQQQHHDHNLHNHHHNNNSHNNPPTTTPAEEADDFGPNTWISAGGSNGVILLWNGPTLGKHYSFAGGKNQQPNQTTTTATKATATTTPTTTAATPIPPDAVLRQHVRAVNRIAWHPRDSSIFLSASQDGTVRLWERKRQMDAEKSNPNNNNHYNNSSSNNHHLDQEPNTGGGPGRLFQLPIFGGSFTPHVGHAQKQGSWVWQCTRTFEPKSEAVRDVAWNPFLPDIFALVTAGGTLVAYHRTVKIRSLVKLTAHGREASCLDWHPRLPNIVATGGANDGSVKIWDLTKQLDPELWSSTSNNKPSNPLTSIVTTQANLTSNAMSMNSRTESIQTESSDNTERSNPTTFLHSRTQGTATSGGLSLGGRAVHVLSVAASVTRVKWRPSAGESFVPAGTSSNVERSTFFDDDWSEDEHMDHPLYSDRHDVLLAVSTAPVGWVSAGGAGVIGLWSCHRPFMALSVVEGHREGAVVDFVWLETPVVSKNSRIPLSMSGRLVSNRTPTATNVFDRRSKHRAEDTSLRSLTSTRNDDAVDTSDHSGTWLEPSHGPVASNAVVGIWQHVLSVGKDGRCIVQSLMRGDRPLSRVPPSCFAMANLSPFQRGYGSLQLFTVCQPVPTGARHDYLLTGLRRDAVTAEAPGMFRETPNEEELAAASDRAMTSSSSQWSAARRLPPRDPAMVFNVLDQGDLNSENLPPSTEQPEAITVAPEVVHLSRFAGSYLLRPTEEFPTRAALCLHNSHVADQLNRVQVAHAWIMLASILEGSGIDDLTDPTNHEEGSNVMSFLILPTVKSMMEELAEEGDVQTCVAICEVLEILTPNGTTKIPDLDINQVREWYMSYIDILRDMCLFSYASEIIQRCVDPYIADLNKQSTTIHEACPNCRKPMLQDSSPTLIDGSVRRTCKNCRRRVGMCFLCHQPVKGLFVWCPGCGHGGHLEHALSWFGGLSGTAVRELCPTGCGHRCNRLQAISAFPRTESLRELDA